MGVTFLFCKECNETHHEDFCKRCHYCENVVCYECVDEGKGTKKDGGLKCSKYPKCDEECAYKSNGEYYICSECERWLDNTISDMDIVKELIQTLSAKNISKLANTLLKINHTQKEEYIKQKQNEILSIDHL